jgi:hypothetical protein
MKAQTNTVERPGAEQQRLAEAREQRIPWKKWGPYLSERQWGTVREDYSEDGNAWDYFSHDQGAPAHITGARRDWRDSPRTSSSFALRLPCGTGRTRF